MANPVVFRRNTNIGATDAESDDQFLENCFVDTGDLDALLDCTNAKSIILGRTGSGKTALIKQVIRRCQNYIEISPQDLSLNYI